MCRLSMIFTVFTCVIWAAPTYFDATDARIVYSGSRFSIASTNVSFVWSGATISTSFTGTSIGVLMRDPHGQYDVFIDGQKTFTPFNPKASVVTAFSLASELSSDETHTFVLRKRTEAYSDVFGDGTATIVSFFVDDGKNLLPPTDTSSSFLFGGRKIEVIGDSVTCGFGILGESAACNFTFDTQDYFHSYSYLVAQKFKAQINTICWSGKGLARNFNTSCDPYPCNDSLPYYYNYTLDTMSSDITNQWNFSSYIPDAVIINLGVNDFDSANPPPMLSNDTFRDTYVQFVRSIRAKYIKIIPIFLVCRAGSPLPGPCNLVELAVRDIGDTDVHYVDITPELASPLGCGGHPGLSGHRQMADKLIAGMGSVVGWSVVSPPSHLEASSAVLLGAFFLIGLGGHIWGCVVRKPKAKGNLLLEQKQDR